MKRCLTRRETLKAGVLAGLGAAVSVTPLSGFAGTAAPIAVIDLRLRERRGFAIWCRNNGFEMIGISHDLDQVWLDLRARLRTAPVPVIGLTRPSAQMVFSDLGASCGLRTVFRGNHQTDAMNTIGHRFTGSQSSGDVFGRGLRNGADGWSAALAPALRDAIAVPRQPEAASRTLNSDYPASAVESGRMVSWALVPALREA